MRIGANIPAMQARYNMSKAYQRINAATERLSSGYRISSASDNAALYAVGNKLKTQSQAIEQASVNASNGISMIQTAEGALNEVHAMLQRMRELAVHASNDTNETADVKKMQEEIDELRQEISEVTYKCDYNTIKLLSGACGRIMETAAPTGTGFEVLRLNDSVPYGDLFFSITEKPKEATQITGTTVDNTVLFDEGTFTVNGVSVNIADGDTIDVVINKIQDALDTEGMGDSDPDGITVAWDLSGNELTITSNNPYSINNPIAIKGSPEALKNLGLTAGTTESKIIEYVFSTTGISKEATEIISATVDNTVLFDEGEFTINGVSVNIADGDTIDVVINKIQNALNAEGVGNWDSDGITVTWDLSSNELTIISNDPYGANNLIAIDGSPELLVKLGLTAGVIESESKYGTVPAANTTNGLTSEAVFQYRDGRLTITDRNGAELYLDITLPDVTPGGDTYDYQISSRKSALVLQVGPNMNMDMQINIPKISAKTLGLDKIGMWDHVTANEAIEICDKAIDVVSNIRSKLGAYQNRLEHTIANLDSSQIDADLSLSRVVDTDMAYEMTEYTKNKVIYEAGVSILAQANQIPQSVLQMLR